MLTVTGDNPAVSAVVAINFAAIAADEARSTLLIDTDAGASTVAAALRFRASQGLSGLVTQKLSWPEAVRSARIGRDSAIDVVPSGPDAPPFQAVSALLQSDASRLARRYDTIVLVSVGGTGAERPSQRAARSRTWSTACEPDRPPSRSSSARSRTSSAPADASVASCCGTRRIPILSELRPVESASARQKSRRQVLKRRDTRSH